ncbi:hypothetical protein JCM1841_003012 [Sporobolomyces salmonicolor]
MPSTPTSSSIHSLRSALSEAADTDRASRLLFSPESAKTAGTGATGSTESAGEATRSLVQSVAGRGSLSGALLDGATSEPGQMDCSGPRNTALQGLPFSGSTTMHSHRDTGSSEASWDQLSGSPSPPRQRPFFVQLPTPEPERTYSVIQEVERPYIKQEEDDEDDCLALAFEPTAQEEHRSPAMTSSQEEDGLERSVTRSQSDFSRWLEETMRLARGDGMSTIESDDALSSIILATRQTRIGLGPATSHEDTASLLGTPIQLEAPLSHELESVIDAYEGIEVREETSGPISPADAVKAEEAGKVERDEESAESTTIKVEQAPSRAPSNRRWKALSFLLTCGLTCSLYRHYQLTHPAEPTRSTPRFVPNDNATAVVSHFATPLPVGTSFALPIYALVVTFLAGVPVSFHILRRSLGFRMGATRSRSFSSGSLASKRCTSPLLELNGDALLEARELLPIGVAHYTSNRLRDAISTFSSILPLACAPADKAAASEWLGRSLYRLARQEGHDQPKFAEAAKAFERSIRMDQTRATPRASLGKAKYRLGDYDGAVTALRGALKRDDQLSWAHEWLGKSLFRLDSSSAQVEEHLRSAIALKPSSYTALAFFGELLHSRGRTAEARTHLEAAISLRIDYPAAHARLAFIANEQVDPARAASHLRVVLSTRDEGLKDDCMPVSEEATTGTTPFLSLYFVTPADDKETRRGVLRRALSQYPHDDLLSLLLAIELAPSVKSRSSPKERSSSPEKAALAAREEALQRRAERYGDEDLEAHGLWALALLARGKLKAAEEVYGKFWKAIGELRAAERDGGEAKAGEKARRMAFLIMAFWEVKGTNAQSKSRSTRKGLRSSKE